jgi:hypothetical protein
MKDRVGRRNGQRRLARRAAGPTEREVGGDDLEIGAILGAIVRRWQTPATYISAGAMGLPRRAREEEHVVPIRVLVERMIMEPAECRDLFEKALTIAWITKTEHRQIGFLIEHEELYGRMLDAPLSQLPELGLDRYRDRGSTSTGLQADCSSCLRLRCRHGRGAHQRRR